MVILFGIILFVGIVLFTVCTIAFMIHPILGCIAVSYFFFSSCLELLKLFVAAEEKTKAHNARIDEANADDASTKKISGELRYVEKLDLSTASETEKRNVKNYLNFVDRAIPLDRLMDDGRKMSDIIKKQISRFKPMNEAELAQKYGPKVS